jgi:hypothetical protein
MVVSVRKTVLAVTAAAAFALPATAQVLPDAEAKLKAALETAVQEHVVFLNCTVTDPQTHPLIRRGWDDMVASAVALLEAAKAEPALVEHFRERADYAKLIRRDARFSDIIAMCQSDWIERVTQLRYLLLNVRVSEILGAG